MRRSVFRDRPLPGPGHYEQPGFFKACSPRRPQVATPRRRLETSPGPMQLDWPQAGQSLEGSSLFSKIFERFWMFWMVFPVGLPW